MSLATRHDATPSPSLLHKFHPLAANQDPDLFSGMNRDVYSEIVQNHDILSVIIGFLAVDPTSATDEVRERRRTLLNAALACEGLKEPALDTLWSVLPSFLPLFRLLPCFSLVDNIHILDDIQEADWGKFDYYARRVRVLFLTGPAPAISRFAYMCIARQRHSPLTPGIRKLHINSNDPNSLSDALLALNSGLEVVELHNLTLGNREFLHLFFHTLKRDVPKLRRLLIEGEGIINLRPILWFDNLEQVDIKLYNCHLSPRFIDRLGNLEHLHDVVLHVGAPQPSDAPPLIRPGLDDQPTSQRSSHRFDQIRSLHLIGEVRWTNRLMEHMELRNVKRFVFEEVYDQTGTKPESFWKQSFQNLSSATIIEEMEIRQCGQRKFGHPGYSLSATWMSSLFQNHYLTSLVITGAAFSASDDDILSILTAFPSLKKLTLPQSFYESSPTIVSVLQLSLRCPLLEEVEICVGGTAPETVKVMKERIDQIPRLHDHPLRALRISSFFNALQHQDIVEYARFIHRAFSNLVTIEGVGPRAQQESWSVVQTLYMVLQTELRILRGQ